MRIIRYTLRKKVKAVVIDAIKEHALETDFGLDVFALLRLKGSGIPTADRLRKMVRHRAPRLGVSTISLEILCNKRALHLRKIAASPAFVGYMTGADVINAFRGLLSTLDTLQKKIRQSQCLTCKLLTGCEFGKQYGGRVYDITKAIDPDYSKKVDPNCPVKPDLDKSNLIAQASMVLAAIAEAASEAERKVISEKMPPADRDALEDLAGIQEDISAAGGSVGEDDDDPGAALDDTESENENFSAPATAFRSSSKKKNPLYRANHAGNNIIPAEDVVNKLTAAQLALYDLGQKFSTLLAAGKKGKFAPTQENTQDNEAEKMKDFSDVSRLSSSQHALPNEIYEAKMDNKGLTKKQSKKPEEKKKLLYVLIDASGSMSGWLNQANAVTRSELAMVLSVALSKRLEEDKGWMFVRFFESSVSRPLKGIDKLSYEEVRRMITRCSFTGGGTDIAGALKFALDDIKQSKEVIASSEILMITDCEDHLNEATLKKEVGDTEFNVLDVSGVASTSNASGILRKLATKYFKASGTELDPEKIVALI